MGEGSLGPEIKGSGSPFGPRDPVVAGVRCSVAGRAQVGGREGLGGGRREQSGAVQSQKETAPREGAGGGHCSSSEDSCEMPSSSSFSSFLGLPLGFLPGVVVVFRVLAAPLFLLPFGRPRGLLGVGTSLGSFGGCLRGRPRPRFSAPSFSCLEARGWLDFELDSLIFPRQQSRRGATAGRELGCRPAVRSPSCRERRCWALRTGLAPPPPPPPPLVANADAFLEPRQGQK